MKVKIINNHLYQDSYPKDRGVVWIKHDKHTKKLKISSSLTNILYKLRFSIDVVIESIGSLLLKHQLSLNNKNQLRVV